MISNTFSSIIGALIIIYIVVVSAGFGHLVGCHTMEILKDTSISNPTFHPEGQQVGFVILKTYYRSPIGICAFPDGGTKKIEKKLVEVYSIGRADSTPKQIAVIPSKNNYWINIHTADDVYWQEDKLYFDFVEENVGEESIIHTVSVNMESGMYAQQGQNKSPDKVRQNPIDEGEWVTYEQDYGIVSYYGGDYVKFKEDSIRGVWIDPRFEKRVLKHTWLTQEVINEL